MIPTPLLLSRLLCRLGAGASISPSIGLDFRFRGCTGFALLFPSPVALLPALTGLKSSLFGTSAMPSCSSNARFAAIFFSRSSSLRERVRNRWKEWKRAAYYSVGIVKPQGNGNYI